MFDLVRSSKRNVGFLIWSVILIIHYKKILKASAIYFIHAFLYFSYRCFTWMKLFLSWLCTEHGFKEFNFSLNLTFHWIGHTLGSVLQNSQRNIYCDYYWGFFKKNNNIFSQLIIISKIQRNRKIINTFESRSQWGWKGGGRSLDWKKLSKIVMFNIWVDFKCSRVSKQLG